jgi:hypothetical protein
MAKLKKKPARPLSKAKLRKIKNNLIPTYKSCLEGYDGVWDPSGEGREGFICMADALAEVARLLGPGKEIDQADTEHEAKLEEEDQDEQE